MVDAIINRKPVQFFENGCDVVSFVTLHDSSSCGILCCLQTFNLCLGQASKKTFTIVQL